MDARLESAFRDVLEYISKYVDQVPTRVAIELLEGLKSTVEGIFTPSEACELERLQFKQWWYQEKQRADQSDRVIAALRNRIETLESRVTLDEMLADERVESFLDDKLSQEDREMFTKIIDQLESPIH